MESGNPYEDVYLGKAGTGAAFELPDSGGLSPLSIIQMNREKRRLADDKIKAAHDKALQDANDKFPKAFQYDYPNLEKAKDRYLQANAFEYAQNRDPLDPRNPNYVALQNLKQQTTDAYNQSATHAAQYEAANKILEANPDKFDVEGTKALRQLWAEMPLEERLKHPMPGNKGLPFDIQKAQIAFGKDINDPDVTSKVYADPGTQQIINEKTTFYTPEQKSLYGMAFLLNPEVDKYVSEKFSALSPGDKKNYLAKAEAQNRLLAKRGSTDRVTPEGVYAASFIPKLNMKKVEKTSHNMREDDGDNFGFGVGNKEAVSGEQYLKMITSLQKGATDYFNETAITPEYAGLRHANAKQTSVFNGIELGKFSVPDPSGSGVIEKPNIVQNVIRDPDGRMFVLTTKDITDGSGFHEIGDIHGQLGIHMLKHFYGEAAGYKALAAAKEVAEKKYKDNFKNGHPDYDNPGYYTPPTPAYGSGTSTGTGKIKLGGKK